MFPNHDDYVSVYFDVHFEDYNYEEDLESEDEERRQAASAAPMDVDAELRAAASIGRLLGVRVLNEGHNSYGDLVCKFAIQFRDLPLVLNELERRMQSGAEIDTDEPYHVVRGFVLYPDEALTNGRRIEFDDWGEFLATP